MISPISFCGTYKVSNQHPNTNVKLGVFKDFAQSMYKSYSGANIVSRKEMVQKTFSGKIDAKEEETLIVPDELDKNIELFCSEKGIKFEKLYTHDLLDTRKITKRIKEAPKGYRKVEVNPKKLEVLARNQKSNILSCQSKYNSDYKTPVITMLREGSDFSAATLRIDPMEGYLTFGDFGNEMLKSYIQTHGTQHLNHNQIGLYFIESKGDIDCYTYFAFKTLGMEKIPVYVDDLSYKAGCILGLFE